MAFRDLFKPKWKHSNWAVRMKALEKIKEQELIIEIAKNDENIKVRKAAIEKIDDPKLVEELKLLPKNATESNPFLEILNRQKSKSDRPTLLTPDLQKLLDLEDTPYRSKGSSSSSPIQPKSNRPEPFRPY